MSNLNSIRGKTREEKLNFLSKLEYSVLLKRKENKFYLIIPELSIVASSENLDMAYKDLDKQKQDYFEYILDSGAEDEVNLPCKFSRKQQIFCQLKLFTYKLLIVCFLLGSTFIFGAVAIRDKVANISGADLAQKVMKSAYEQIIQFNNAPEEVKQIRIERLHKFLSTIKPMVDEFKSVFSTPDNKAAGVSGQ